MASDDDTPSSRELAAERTDWAEDRTLLANERTFAGWMRTGLAAVGIGAGFQALFGKLEPAFLARGIATVFVLAGVFIFVVAARSANRVCARLHSHAAHPLRGVRINAIAWMFAGASCALLVGIWSIALR